jgi:hypothetical protein
MGTQSTITEMLLEGGCEPAVHRPREFAVRLMKKVKHAFDPTGILNPGKIFNESSERRG